MTAAYEKGFNEKCAEYGVDPRELVKQAVAPIVAGGLGLLGLGAGIYGLYRTFKDFRNYKPQVTPQTHAQAQAARNSSQFGVNARNAQQAQLDAVQRLGK